jgi:hypothetical protein
MNGINEYQIPFLQPRPINLTQAKYRFEECYKSMCSYEFILDDFNQDKTFMGSKEKKICAFCGKDQSQVTFKKDAHILPASFGNRWLFSFEECDICNSDFGQNFENEIAKMFEAQRIISRIPKRSGFPKIKITDKNSKLEVESKGRLIISTQIDEDLIKILPIDDNSFTLVLPGQTYNPISSIKSIAHAVWLLLDQVTREKYENLLRWIKNEITILPITYYEGMIPGPGYNVVGIKIWELFKAIPEMPQLLVKFYFGNSFVFWGLPDFQKETSYPGILPPLQCAPYPPYQPLLKLNKVLKDEKMKVTERTFTMHYNSVTKELDLGNAEIPELFKETVKYVETNEKLPSQLPIIVKLTASDDNNTLEVDHAFLSVKKVKDDELEILVSGGQLAGNLRLTARDKSCAVEFEEDLTLLPLDLSKNSHLLLSQIGKGCKLSITPLNTTLIRPLEITLTTSNKNVDSEDYISNVFKALELINNNLNLDIRFPQDLTKSYRDITLLAAGIEHGKVKEDFNNVEVSVNKEQLIQLMKILDGNTDIDGGLNLYTFSIGDAKIDDIKMRIEIIKPQFAEEKDINIIVEKINENQIVKVKLNCEGIIHTFDDYAK